MFERIRQVHPPVLVTQMFSPLYLPHIGKAAKEWKAFPDEFQNFANQIPGLAWLYQLDGNNEAGRCCMKRGCGRVGTW